MVPMVVDNGNTMKIIIVVEVPNGVDLIPTIGVTDNISLFYKYMYMYFIGLGNRGGSYRGGSRGGNGGYNGNGYQKSSQYQQNNEQQQVHSAPANQQQ